MQLRIASALIITASTLGIASPAASQYLPQWSVGAGYLMSRPRDVQVWGLHARREQQLSKAAISRFVGSVNFIGAGLFQPMLATIGADIGVRGEGSRVSAQFTVGPTVALFLASRETINICQPTCVDIRTGYESGARLAGSAALAIGYKLNRQLRLYYEARGHIPFRLGHAGFAGDPNAGFVELAFGVTVIRGGGSTF